MVVHGFSAAMEASASCQKVPGAIGCRARWAEIAPPRATFDTLAASRQKNENDAVTGRKVWIIRGAGGDNRGSGFMANRHWHRTGTITVDHRQVGMAQAGSINSNQQFTGLGLVEFKLSQFERLAGSIGPRLIATLPEDSSCDCHAHVSAPTSFQRPKHPQSLLTSKTR